MLRIIFFAGWLASFLGLSLSSSSQEYTLTYKELSFPGSGKLNGNSTLLTGVRHVVGEELDIVYISGFTISANFSELNKTFAAFIYEGPITGGGEWHLFEYPSSENITVTGTSFYGPNSLAGGIVQVAGSYAYEQNGISEVPLYYEGNLHGDGTWKTLYPQVLDTENTVFQAAAHSTMGGLVVGGFYTIEVEARAFIYDIKHDWYNELIYPEAKGVTAYGVWYLNGTEYYITGGVVMRDDDVGYAFICNWDSVRRESYNWKLIQQSNLNTYAHFEGISAAYISLDNNTSSADNNNPFNASSSQYTFAADWKNSNHKTDLWNTSFVIVPNISDTTVEPIWIDVWFPGSTNNSANTVYMNNLICKFAYPDSKSTARGGVVTITWKDSSTDNTSNSNKSFLQTTKGIVVIVVIICVVLGSCIAIIYIFYCQSSKNSGDMGGGFNNNNSSSSTSQNGNDSVTSNQMNTTTGGDTTGVRLSTMGSQSSTNPLNHNDF